MEELPHRLLLPGDMDRLPDGGKEATRAPAARQRGPPRECPVPFLRGNQPEESLIVGKSSGVKTWVKVSGIAGPALCHSTNKKPLQ